VSASLIIVIFKTGSVLRECLAAAGRAENVGDIVVVDNGNVGFAKACNLGATQARGDPLFFVNPDVVLNPHAIAHITAALAAAPPPAIVGGDLRNSDGRPERGSRRERLTSWRAFVSVTGLSRLERWAPALRDFNCHTDPLPREAARVNCISGALFALRKADFDAIGGLDEDYFLHVDDVDQVTLASGASGVGVAGAAGIASGRSPGRSPGSSWCASETGACWMTPLTRPARGPMRRCDEMRTSRAARLLAATR